MRKKWAIIGGGNGGQAQAGHLALAGHAVRIYDIIPETVDAINAQGGVALRGAVTGLGRVEFATSDLAKLLDGVECVMITTPAFAHAELARQCAPLLRDGQYIYLHPGSTLGALEFLSVVRKAGCQADITVSEMNTLVYACRADKPGQVQIFGVKKEVMLGTIPADRTEAALALVRECYPQMYAARNALESSLANANTIMHPGPTLLNTALIESGRDWCYYTDGFCDSIGRFAEGMDAERVAIARAYDTPVYTLLDWYRTAYGVEAKSLGEAARNNPSYQGIAGQKRLDTRYLFEDIPFGLVPLIELARLKGVPAERMEVVTALGKLMVGPERFVEGRTMRNMGFGEYSAERLQEYIVRGQ